MRLRGGWPASAGEMCGHCGADLAGVEIVPWSGLARCQRCGFATEPVDGDGLTALDRADIEQEGID